MSSSGPPGLPDLSDLFQQAREAQEKMQQVQRELAVRRIEGNSGGGMVTAVVSGALRVLEIRIEPQLVESGDREMLQDLVAAAVNAALTNAQQVIQREMQAVSSAIPGLGALGGAGNP